MQIKVELDEGAFMPEYAHFGEDAGADIKTPIGFPLHPHEGIIIDTGIHVAIPKGYVGMLKSKSGLNTKHGISSEGVIDSGYTGSIHVKLYNQSNCIYCFDRGDKISQLVIMPFAVCAFEKTETLYGGSRGNNGFGSTGR